MESSHYYLIRQTNDMPQKAIRPTVSLMPVCFSLKAALIGADVLLKLFSIRVEKEIPNVAQVSVIGVIVKNMCFSVKVKICLFNLYITYIRGDNLV